MRQKWNVDTKIVFHIGDPVQFATTPFISNQVYELAGVDAVNLPVHVKPGEMDDFIHCVKYLNAAGFGLTMPYKSQILPYLDECEPLSRDFNSINFVRNVNGKLEGRGTDGEGMGEAVEDLAGGDISGKSALVIGGGAVAGPIAAALAKRGVTEITIANRTREKAEKIAEILLKHFPDLKVQVVSNSNEDLDAAAAVCDIMVQATSLGMTGGKKYDYLGFIDHCRPECLCADVLYPTSDFLEKCASRGLKNVSGCAMLINQMFGMMEYQFGVTMDPSTKKDIEDAMVCAVALRSNRNQRLGLE